MHFLCSYYNIIYVIYCLSALMIRDPSRSSRGCVLGYFVNNTWISIYLKIDWNHGYSDENLKVVAVWIWLLFVFNLFAKFRYVYMCAACVYSYLGHNFVNNMFSYAELFFIMYTFFRVVHKIVSVHILY